MIRKFCFVAMGVLYAGVAGAVVVGNEDWHPPWGGTPTTNAATFSDNPAQMTGRVMTSSKWKQAYKWDVPLYYGCVDGTFGNNATVSANTNQVDNSALAAQDNTAYVDFELTAGEAFNITLDTFHFDAFRQYAGGGTSGYRLEILSGGALAPQVLVTNDVFAVDGPASTNNPPNLDYQDIDVPVSVTNNLLPAGETVVFRLSYDQSAAGWAGEGMLDNMAVSGSAEPLPVPGISLSGTTNEVAILNGSTNFAWNNATKCQSEYGRESTTNLYTITSTGNLALELTGTPVVNLTGDTGVFILTAQPTTTSMAPGASQTFEIVYTPDMEDVTNNLTVTIENNAANFTFDIQGISPLLASDLSLQYVKGNGWLENGATNAADVSVKKGTDMASAPMGSAAVSTFTIHSTGYTNLNLGAITLDGDAGFSVIQPVESIVERETNTTFSVVYTPTVADVTNTTIVTIPNDSAHNDPYTFMVRAVGRVEASGQVVAGWTYVEKNGNVEPAESGLVVATAHHTTTSGGGIWNSKWNDSQDYTYGNSGGQVSLNNYDNGMGNSIQFNSGGSAASISVDPTLVLTISNLSATASIPLTSIHFDGAVHTANALADVVISLAGDLSGVVGTQHIDQVGTGWGSPFGSYDIAITDTNMIIAPTSTVEIVFTIENAALAGNWKEVLLDNIAIKGILDPFSIWIGDFPGVGIKKGRFDDPDNDKLMNVFEYLYGGDPSDGADTGYPRSLINSGAGLDYIYTARKDVTHYLMLTDSLAPASWNNSGYTVIGSGDAPGDSDFETRTNRIDTAGHSAGFIQVVIEE